MAHTGIMEKKMEPITMGYIQLIGYIVELYWDTGKEHGNETTSTLLGFSV